MTMTTVGFGDKYPRTTLGKCVGFVAMLVGMILIAVPVAIVGNKFQEVYENYGDEEATQRAKKVMKMEATNSLAAEPNWKLMARGVNPGEHTDVVGNICDSLGNVAPLVSDPALAATAKKLSTLINVSWAARGHLRRDRKKTISKQEEMSDKLDAFVEGIMKSWSYTGSKSSTDLSLKMASTQVPLSPPVAQQ